MARTRTGSAVDAVDESDKGVGDVGNAPEMPDAPKPIPAGYVRVRIDARRNGNPDPKSDGTFPPGEYDLPKDEAMHFVTTGAAKVVAV